MSKNVKTNPLLKKLVANLKQGELYYILNKEGFDTRYVDYSKMETRYGHTNPNNYANTKAKVIHHKIDISGYTDLDKIEVETRTEYLKYLKDLKKHRKEELTIAQNRMVDCEEMIKYLEKEVED